MGRRSYDTPCETIGQRAGEFLGAHADSSTPEPLHKPHLLAGKAVALPGEGAFEVVPGLSEKLGVLGGPVCQILHCVLAQHSPWSTITVVV